ncbi:MAG: HAD-IIIA family hydrolase [bacterium]
MKKILVIRLGSLGDVIIASAPILNLKLNYPKSHITFFTKVQFAHVVKMFEGVDAIVTLSPSSKFTDFIRTLHQLDRNNFDIVVDLHGNFRSLFAHKLITSSQTVIYPKRRLERYAIVKNKTRPNSYPHTIDLYNDCIKQLGGTAFVTRPQMFLDKIDDEKIYNIKPAMPAVLVAPGAAHENKQWPSERFTEVAIRIYEKTGMSIFWATSSSDKVENSPAGKIPDNHFFEIKDYPLDKLASIISQCKLTIANDSGIAHLSSAVGTPTLSIFGSTHPALGFSPRGLFDKVIEVEEWCRPCSLHGKKTCFREERFCFNRISTDMVYDSASNLLNSKINNDRAMFVDRDGTLIVDKDYISDPDQVEFENGVIVSLKEAHAHGFKIIIVSNQSGVARGFFDIETVNKVNQRILDMLAMEGVDIDGIYFCPHYKNGTVPEYTKICQCRKPSPGMPEEAAGDLGIDLRKSWVIGDKFDDVRLGIAMGGRGILVRTGYGFEAEQHLNGNCFSGRVSVVDNLHEGVEKIISLE